MGWAILTRLMSPIEFPTSPSTGHSRVFNLWQIITKNGITIYNKKWHVSDSSIDTFLKLWHDLI
jgi:hypothetical protein